MNGLRYLYSDYIHKVDYYCKLKDCNRAPCNCEFVKCQELIMKKENEP